MRLCTTYVSLPLLLLRTQGLENEKNTASAYICSYDDYGSLFACSTYMCLLSAVESNI